MKPRVLNSVIKAQKQTKRSPGMKPWSKENRTYVASMTSGDFFGSEQSHIMENQGAVKIVLKKGRSLLSIHGLSFD